VPLLHHAIGFEQGEESTPPAFHRGAVVTDPGMHGRRRSPQQTPQAREHGIFPGLYFHRRNMMPAIETALNTACMIIGTSSEPLFS